MRKHLALATICLTSLLLTACSTSTKEGSTGTVWEKIKAKNELVVATPTTYQPTSYYNDNNELVGYEVDLMKAIGEKLDVKVTFVETGFEQAFTSVDSGRVDLSLNNLDITPERKEKYNISEPYKYGVGGMIVRADGTSGIEKSDLSDWSGKKAAGAAGTNFMKIAEKLGAELVTYDNVSGDIYLNDVANGRTDFIPNDYTSQKLFVAALKSENPDLNVKVSDVMYNPSEQGIIMSKKDKSLLKKINQAIAELKADGTLKKLSETYYGGEDLTVPFTSDKDIPVIDLSDNK